MRTVAPVLLVVALAAGCSSGTSESEDTTTTTTSSSTTTTILAVVSPEAVARDREAIIAALEAAPSSYFGDRANNEAGVGGNDQAQVAAEWRLIGDDMRAYAEGWRTGSLGAINPLVLDAAQAGDRFAASVDALADCVAEADPNVYLGTIATECDRVTATMNERAGVTGSALNAVAAVAAG